MKAYITFFLTLLSVAAMASPSKPNGEIRIENNKLAVAFDKKTGALIRMINKSTGDNYIKQAKGGNLFRLFVNTDSMPNLVAGPHNEAYGGLRIDPADCLLQRYVVKKRKDTTILTLEIVPQSIALTATITIQLAGNADFFDGSMTVTNHTGSALRVYGAFPYLSGISLGDNPSTNLAVHMWDRGYPGIRAWEKKSGGVYGKDVSMQWQCVYEPAMDEGFAFITLDTAFSNKILTCFPGGGMQSLYFDQRTIAQKAAYQWPAARIAVFKGNWRTAAKMYRNWSDQHIRPRPVPHSYSEGVAIRGSAWIPNWRHINSQKKSNHAGAFTSFNNLIDLYKHGYSDCLEVAMWNDGVNLWPETYGPWMSSGFIDFRADLGGRAAFTDGVKMIHQAGRKLAMYVAGYGIRTTSPLFKNGDWKNWAIVNNAQGDVNFGYAGEGPYETFGITVCPGYKPWQDNMIRVCTMLAETGVDEIRLDEMGFPFRPCFNPAHEHENPYATSLWMREFLHRIRQATDRINPDLVITTEFPMDYFHTYTNGALVMDCSGKELDVMKVAMPAYLPLSYHAGAAEAAVTGAIMGKPEAYRQNWAWGHVGVERPDDYPKGPGAQLPFYELYPTFSAALLKGDVTEKDPVAINDAKWAGHLWKHNPYWILTGGHDDLTPLPDGGVQVVLPELSPQFKMAYEFDLQTLEMKPVDINRGQQGISIRLTSALSLVFFPAPDCPPLAIIDNMDKVVKPGSNVEVSIRLFSPWNTAKQQRNISITTPNSIGFQIKKEHVGANGASFSIPIPANVETNNYWLKVQQDCLPLRKWFRVE